MSESIMTFGNTSRTEGKALAVSLWMAQVAVAGILAMAAFTKLFAYTPEGSMALAEALGVGRGVITVIGLVELSAAALILIPKRHALGGLLAAFAMVEALFSHATKVGWSGSPAAEMWPMALAVLVMSVFVIVGRRDTLPRSF